MFGRRLNDEAETVNFTGEPAPRAAKSSLMSAPFPLAADMSADRGAVDAVMTALCPERIRGLGISKTLRRPALGGCLVLMLGATGVAIPTTGHTRVNIEGTVTSARVTTSRDAVSDVLAALCKTFNVRYSTSIPLERSVSGTYSGSVTQVISRLLDGNSYVVKSSEGVIEITVFGTKLGTILPGRMRELPISADTKPSERGLPVGASGVVTYWTEPPQSSIDVRGKTMDLQESERGPAVVVPTTPSEVGLFYDRTTLTAVSSNRMQHDPTIANECSPIPGPATSPDLVPVVASEPSDAPPLAPTPIPETKPMPSLRRAPRLAAASVGEPGDAFSRIFPGRSTYFRTLRSAPPKSPGRSLSQETLAAKSGRSQAFAAGGERVQPAPKIPLLDDLVKAVSVGISQILSAP
jgi:hypothetical protein